MSTDHPFQARDILTPLANPRDAQTPSRALGRGYEIG